MNINSKVKAKGSLGIQVIRGPNHKPTLTERLGLWFKRIRS